MKTKTTSRLRQIIVTMLAVLFAVGGALTVSACADDATVVSDNFEVDRRVVFFNGITDTYLLEIEGRCSIVDEGTQLEVTCKVSDDEYKKHFLGLSDNVSYFVEQMESVEADPYHYRVTFKPEVIVPDIDLRTSGDQEG